MRHAAAALALLAAAAGLSACAGTGPDEMVAAREDEGQYEANVREWVEAMQLGMARARRDLALRAVRRMMERPS